MSNSGEADGAYSSCARDSVRLERLCNPATHAKPLMVLYEGSTVLREVGATTPPTMRDDDAPTERRIRVVDSRKVLTKRPKKRGATPPISVETLLEPAPANDGNEEEVEIPEPVRLSSAPLKELPLVEPAEEEDEDGYFTGDTMCAWCDDGGSLVMCDGPCMRGFHMDRDCNPLKVPEDLKAAIVNSKYPFECPSCWSRTHRCFKCCREIKLDITSDNPAITKCDFADCGKFYCTNCQDEIVKKMEMNFKINSRTKYAFICPLHYCAACGTWEDASTDILFPCRRCPKALHQRCMPRKIRDSPTRIWKAVVSKDGRLSEYSQVSENFFYCMRHQTQNMMQGPLHEIPLFSDGLWKRWRTAYALKFRCLKSSEPYIPERNRAWSGDLSVALTALSTEPPVTSMSDAEAMKVAQKKRQRARQYADEKELQTAMNIPMKRVLAVKARSQLRSLMENTMTSISIKDVENELMPVYPYQRRQTVKLTEDRLYGFVRAVECAKKDSGLSLEHIPSGMVQQMKSALKGMRVSCAPFLQSRYTSYGRHFTKTAVLTHIVHHVIGHCKPNDLVVDFSCGSNEFIGIIVDFCKGHDLKIRVRGYDLFTPLRLDGFVRKNWFDVTAEELDKGENLIVGLNPPFGVKAYLADRFVGHAAKFSPRLMLLICPPETAVPVHYSIIHEDLTLCKDKAFYIPGLRADQGNDIAPVFRILKRD